MAGPFPNTDPIPTPPPTATPPIVVGDLIDISSLTLVDTFEHWFVTTNEVISRLNNVNIFEVLPNTAMGMGQYRDAGVVWMHIKTGDGLGFDDSGALQVDLWSVESIQPMVEDEDEYLIRDSSSAVLTIGTPYVTGNDFTSGQTIYQGPIGGTYPGSEVSSAEVVSWEPADPGQPGSKLTIRNIVTQRRIVISSLYVLGEDFIPGETVYQGPSSGPFPGLEIASGEVVSWDPVTPGQAGSVLVLKNVNGVFQESGTLPISNTSETVQYYTDSVTRVPFADDDGSTYIITIAGKPFTYAVSGTQDGRLQRVQAQNQLSPNLNGNVNFRDDVSVSGNVTIGRSNDPVFGGELVVRKGLFVGDFADAASGDGRFLGNVVVEGDLTVNGTQTTVNSTVVTIDDIAIELAAVQPTPPTDSEITTAGGGGLILHSSSPSGNKTLLWTDDSGYQGDSGWELNDNLTITSGKHLHAGQFRSNHTNDRFSFEGSNTNLETGDLFARAMTITLGQTGQSEYWGIRRRVEDAEDDSNSLGFEFWDGVTWTRAYHILPTGAVVANGNQFLAVNWNADLLDGYHASTVTNTPSAIPVANSDGYVDGEWIDEIKQTSEKIVQAGHGFAVGDVVRVRGQPADEPVVGPAPGTWVWASADHRQNAEALGIVSEVLDVDTFVVTFGGRIVFGSGEPSWGPLTVGEVYFLSETTPGALTVNPPDSNNVGSIRKPMMIATGLSEGIVINYVGQELKDPTDFAYMEGIVPVGTIQAWAGAAVDCPSRWMPCDGRILPAAPASPSDPDYSILASVIGNANYRTLQTGNQLTGTQIQLSLPQGIRNYDIGHVFTIKWTHSGGGTRTDMVVTDTTATTITLSGGSGTSIPAGSGTFELYAGTGYVMLPYLPGRVVVGAGHGDNLTDRPLGSVGGSETLTGVSGPTLSPGEVVHDTSTNLQPYQTSTYIIRVLPDFEISIIRGHDHDFRYVRYDGVQSLTSGNRLQFSENSQLVAYGFVQTLDASQRFRGRSNIGIVNSILNPASNRVLVWNNTTQQYSDAFITNDSIDASAAIAWSKISKTGSLLNDIGNVTAPAPSTGQALTWNGSAWTPQDLWVNTTGDTMTGTLTINAGATSIQVNSGNVVFDNAVQLSFPGVVSGDNAITIGGARRINLSGGSPSAAASGNNIITGLHRGSAASHSINYQQLNETNTQSFARYKRARSWQSPFGQLYEATFGTSGTAALFPNGANVSNPFTQVLSTPFVPNRLVVYAAGDLKLIDGSNQYPIVQRDFSLQLDVSRAHDGAGVHVPSVFSIGGYYNLNQSSATGGTWVPLAGEYNDSLPAHDTLWGNGADINTVGWDWRSVPITIEGYTAAGSVGHAPSTTGSIEVRVYVKFWTTATSPAGTRGVTFWIRTRTQLNGRDSTGGDTGGSYRLFCEIDGSLVRSSAGDGLISWNVWGDATGWNQVPTAGGGNNYGTT